MLSEGIGSRFHFLRKLRTVTYVHVCGGWSWLPAWLHGEESKRLVSHILSVCVCVHTRVWRATLNKGGTILEVRTRVNQKGKGRNPGICRHSLCFLVAMKQAVLSTRTPTVIDLKQSVKTKLSFLKLFMWDIGLQWLPNQYGTHAYAHMCQYLFYIYAGDRHARFTYLFI